nr:MAG TPA: hypothetical protein [Caudoviricetes sp.]
MAQIKIEGIKQKYQNEYSKFIDKITSNDFIYKYLLFKFSPTKIDGIKNQKLYKEFKECDETDYLSDKYIEFKDDFCKNVLDVDEQVFDDILNDVINSNKLELNFQNAKEEFLHNNEQSFAFNTNGDNGTETSFVDDENKEIKEIDEAKDLLEFKDNVGDVIEFSDTFPIDYYNRDYPFIYVDGDIIVGEKKQSHSEMLVEYLEEIGKDKEIPEDMKTKQKKNSRPTTKRLQRLTSSENVAFGHVLNNVAFLETFDGNVSPEKVADECEKQLDIKKVYQYNHKQHMVKRLARNDKVIRIK